MAERRVLQPHITINYNIVQEGDKTDVHVENKSETNINAENIEQLTVQQQDTENEAAEGTEEQDEIIQEVDALNLSSPNTSSSQPSVRRKVPSIQADDTSLSHVDKHDKMNAVDEASDFYSQNPTTMKKGSNQDASKVGFPDRKQAGNSIRCEILKGRANTFWAQSKFSEASAALDKLSVIQGLDVNMMLMKIDCDLHLGKEKKADQTILDVRQFFMTSPTEVDDVYGFASDSVAGESYVRAIILLRISSDMYKLHPSLSPDDIVKGIYKCVSKLDNATSPLIESGDRSKIIALDYGLPYIIEMVDDLRAVANCNPDVKTEHIAWCVNSIGVNYIFANENEKGIEFHKSGLDVMKRQFGQNASKYRIYGHLLQNMGTANYNLGRYKIAEDYYLKAIDAKNNATDFSSVDEKRENIKSSETDLKDTRAKIK